MFMSLHVKDVYEPKSNNLAYYFDFGKNTSTLSELKNWQNNLGIMETFLA